MIVTPSEMRVLEQAAITQEGVPSLRLMENAGMAVVKHYLDSLSKNANGLEKPVLILCGKGNNAGDGMVVARELHTRQVPVHTAFCMGRDFTGDAETEYQRLMASQAPTFDLAEPSSMRSDYSVVMDALLGTGANKSLPKKIDQLLHTVNALPARKIAIDIPTGIHPETGALISEYPFQADETLTFHRAKTGLYLSPGRFFCGEVIVLPIGIAESEKEGSRIIIDDRAIRAFFPKRIPWGHKGSFGKVGILGGSVWYRGAPVLSARAAFNAGCGLVYAFIPSFQDGERPVPFNPETIVRLIPSEDGFISMRQIGQVTTEIKEMNVLLIGPGLGRQEETMALVRAIVDQVRLPIVIDADGLYAFRGATDLLTSRKGSGPLILTPHMGEFATLLNQPVKEVETDALSKAESFARKNHCTLVLKGATTLIVSPDGTVYFNLTGNSGLAVGGSGDILAGLISGFLPAVLEAPERAAALGVYAMGKAAERYAIKRWEGSLTPSSVLKILPFVLKEFEPK